MAASLALFASSLPLSGSWFVDAGLLYALLLVLSATVAWLRRPGFNFKGKHVLVTGGSSGLGKAFAVLCAQRVSLRRSTRAREYVCL
jgi:NADPH:quinone reductase-like Zn-dependent oxidoreductase